MKFAPADERFKQATAYLNRLWKAGLIEPEAFTLTWAQVQAKAQQQPVTYGVFSTWNLFDDFTPADDPRSKDYVAMPFFTAPGVAKPAVYRQPYPGWNRGHMAITKVNKYPEVTVRWVDYHVRSLHHHGVDRGHDRQPPGEGREGRGHHEGPARRA